MPPKENPPSVSYKKFLSSEMFTLRAGPSLEPFYIHKKLLANISQELWGHVFNEMKEGHEGTMAMEDVSPETMCQFLEFCYTGDYQELEFVQGGVAKTKPPIEQLFPNAKLYVLGDMYNIPNLKDVAFGKITARLIVIPLANTDIGVIIDFIGYILKNLPELEEIDPLVEYLGKYLAWGLENVRKHGKFPNLFIDGREDFIKVVFDGLRAGTKAPWG